MTDGMRIAILAVVIAFIAGAIVYLEGEKPERSSAPRDADIVFQDAVPASTPSSAAPPPLRGGQTPAPLSPVPLAPRPASPSRRMTQEEKASRYPRAKELVSPSGFLNAEPFTIRSLVGKKVILVDFWTYSCINCQRTTPYLNSWYAAYRDQGLEIVGVHTPEFLFEQQYDNVKAAIQKFKIRYPVVQDNQYATWLAYENRYWPHKYLIDIDGFIVYDHIGEGGYEETERKIQELLHERMAVLGVAGTVAAGVTRPQGVEPVARGEAQSPEVYFGSLRNELLGNGAPGERGTRAFRAPSEISINSLYLTGEWGIEPEFAEVKASGAKIIFRYQARKVFFVASGNGAAKRIRILRDGQPLGAAKGRDVVQENGESVVRVHADGLYRLVEDSEYGVHTLEIIIEDPGVRAFTFTFG